METCEACFRRFKVLAKKKLCAYCYLDIEGEWAGEFKGAKQKWKKPSKIPSLK